jgi:hypothetical protein
MDRGTAFHAAIELWAASGEVPALGDLEMQGWVDLLAAEWAPPSTGQYEVAWGLAADEWMGKGDPVNVEVDEPAPHVYVARNGGALLTAGRADAVWLDGDYETVRAVDWKTGKWPTTPAVDNLQVNAAGIALALEWGLESYVPGIYYARDGFWDWGPRVTFGTPEFAKIWGEIREAALLDETPRPGPHCSDCWEARTKRCRYALAVSPEAGAA